MEGILIWNGIKAYDCDRTYKVDFGYSLTNSQRDTDNNVAEEAGMDFLMNAAGCNIVGWDPADSPENYQCTERSYAEHWKGETFASLHLERAVMLVYDGFYDVGASGGLGEGIKEHTFIYYFARGYW